MVNWSSFLNRRSCYQLERSKGSWVYPAERTARVVDPMNLIQIMLAKGMENSQLSQVAPKRRE